MSKAWKGGSTRRQRAIRAAVLLRDGYRCQIRNPGTWVVKRTGKQARCLGVADQVHHLHGRGRCAGCAADLPTHQQAACTPCNLRIGDPSAKTRKAPTPGCVTRW